MVTKRKLILPELEISSTSHHKRSRGSGVVADPLVLSDSEDDKSTDVIELSSSPETTPAQPKLPAKKVTGRTLGGFGGGGASSASSFPGFQSANSAIRANPYAFVNNGQRRFKEPPPAYSRYPTDIPQQSIEMVVRPTNETSKYFIKQEPASEIVKQNDLVDFELNLLELPAVSANGITETSPSIAAKIEIPNSEDDDDIYIMEEISTPAHNSQHYFPHGFPQAKPDSMEISRPLPPGWNRTPTAPSQTMFYQYSNNHDPMQNFIDGPFPITNSVPIEQILQNTENEMADVDLMRKRALEAELEKMPKAEQPASVKTKMLSHQLQALAWMKTKENPRYPTYESGECIQGWRRTQYQTYRHISGINSPVQDPPRFFSGGILADDMGLGKTLQIISLIMSDRGNGPTLIVCPLSVMSNWENQIAQHVEDSLPMRVIIYHSKNNKVSSDELQRHDAVITTYNKLAMEDSENSKKTLTNVYWRRVVLDEGHIIRNFATKTCRSACQLRAKSKWVVTGTPIINTHDDLRSLAIFIGIDIRIQNKGAFSLMMQEERKNQAFVADLCLRRTKDMQFVNLKLPPKSEHVKWIEFQKEEAENYKFLLEDAQKAVKRFFRDNGTAKAALWTSVLEKLLRLRQFCNHWRLSAKKAIDYKEEAKEREAEEDLPLDQRLKLLVKSREICRVCWDALSADSEPVIGPCGHAACKTCLTSAYSSGPIICPQCSARYSEVELIETSFESDELDDQEVESHRQSSKTIILYKLIKETLSKDPKSKVVIFSQWTSFLDIVQKELMSMDMAYVRLDGKMRGEDRDKSINALQNDPSIRIMLASLKTAGVGITLTAADTVILADSWWAPAIEEQAVDRIHRLGQTRPTTVYRLVCKNTVEQGVIQIQDEKRKIFGQAFQEKFKVLTGDDTRKMVTRLLQ